MGEKQNPTTEHLLLRHAPKSALDTAGPEAQASRIEAGKASAPLSLTNLNTFWHLAEAERNLGRKVGLGTQSRLKVNCCRAAGLHRGSPLPQSY